MSRSQYLPPCERTGAGRFSSRVVAREGRRKTHLMVRFEEWPREGARFEFQGRSWVVSDSGPEGLVAEPLSSETVGQPT